MFQETGETTRSQTKAAALGAIRELQLGLEMQQRALRRMEAAVCGTELHELPSLLRQVFKKAQGQFTRADYCLAKFGLLSRTVHVGLNVACHSSWYFNCR
jgi:hypothetical protein